MDFHITLVSGREENSPLNSFFSTSYFFNVPFYAKRKHRLSAELSVEQICDKVKMAVWIFHLLLFALILVRSACSNFSAVRNINNSKRFGAASERRLAGALARINAAASRFTLIRGVWILPLALWAHDTEPSSSSSCFDSCARPLDLHHISNSFFLMSLMPSAWSFVSTRGPSDP